MCVCATFDTLLLAIKGFSLQHFPGRELVKEFLTQFSSLNYYDVSIMLNEIHQKIKSIVLGPLSESNKNSNIITLDKLFHTPEPRKLLS